MQTTTQLQLGLNLLRNGDDRARTELIAHACERLRTLTRRMLRGYPALRSWEQTDDVFQNAMMRLYRDLVDVVRIPWHTSTTLPVSRFAGGYSISPNINARNDGQQKKWLEQKRHCLASEFKWNLAARFCVSSPTARNALPETTSGIELEASGVQGRQ